jgi:hypothetical protein
MKYFLKFVHAFQIHPVYTARSNIQQFYILEWNGSQNKQRLFPYTALTDWF